jgi:hypothetical protein
MALRVSLLVLVGSLAFASVACEKIPASFEERGGTFIESVPPDVGTLVGVTSTRPGWSRLWYEKPDKSVVIVTVANDGRVSDAIVTIPRR